MHCTHRILLVVTLLLVSLSGRAELPKAMAWTAYNLGTTGYNQAVAIGKVLKDQHGVTLRVIPGKNDISRLLPLKMGRVQFSANGVATYFAQEGTFQFADTKWGPMPLRVVMMSNGLSNQSLAVAADTGIRQFSELKGKRVPWVRGAPALNVSTEAILACGGLSWDDVKRVDFPGYNAMWNGIIEGQIDAAYATTVSGPTRKLEASRRGIFWPALPHDDDACWQRVTAIAPYFSKHMATRGAAISAEQPHEGGTYPYPLLVTLADQDADLVRELTRAINTGYPAFKDADPGAIGWALGSQQFDWVVPFHDGAISYFQELGVWSEEHNAHNQKLLARQQVLAKAWQEYQALDMDDESTWMKLRALRLQQAGFDPVWQ